MSPCISHGVKCLHAYHMVVNVSMHVTSNVSTHITWCQMSQHITQWYNFVTTVTRITFKHNYRIGVFPHIVHGGELSNMQTSKVTKTSMSLGKSPLSHSGKHACQTMFQTNFHDTNFQNVCSVKQTFNLQTFIT